MLRSIPLPLLYSSWETDEPFIAAANVGIFSSDAEEGTAPDVFLSLSVAMPADWSQKQKAIDLM